MLPLNVLYYGREEALPEQRELRAGPLSLVYEAGDLRYLRVGDQEVLRRVYVAVRDRNWGTVPATLSNVEMEVGPESFRISYDARHQEGEIDFAWRATITGTPEGTIVFAMNGEALSTFLRNRIGFCVLHPIRECAGQPCAVERDDGTVEYGNFPAAISPDQPFVEMRAITHQVLPGLQAEVRFAGDLFEMEDQRNWTDASFKTYCTPLRLIYPVEVLQGARVTQSVTVTLRGQAPEPAATARQERITVEVDTTAPVPLPRLGLGTASHGEPLRVEEIDRLKALNLAHLRLDLDLSRPGWERALAQAGADGAAVGLPLKVAVTVTGEAEMQFARLAAVLEEERPAVAAWLIFQAAEKSTSLRWLQLARRHLGAYEPTARFGAGTNAYFTELNRGRPPVPFVNRVAYSINPQVHAFDNASLVETLAAQAVTVESARAFCAGVPLAVGPVTLRPRFNPDATGPAPESATGELPPEVDDRQMSLFGAGWTLGSLKYLAGAGGVESITYYETTGWRGVMERPGGAPLPKRFRSLPGAVFPLYHVLADVGEFAGGEVVAANSSDPLKVEALGLRQGEQLRLLVANFTPEPQEVEIRGLVGSVRIRTLDETNVVRAMQEPEAFRAAEGERSAAERDELTLQLRPFGVTRVDARLASRLE